MRPGLDAVAAAADRDRAHDDQRSANLGQRVVARRTGALCVRAVGRLASMSTANMHTSQGTIALELFDEDAPETVATFRKLASEGFYDGIIFHRVIRDF